MSTIKRKNLQETDEKHLKRKRVSNTDINVYIPLHTLHLTEDTNTKEKTYTQAEVTELLNKQQSDFRSLLEEKLQEQFVLFNQFYINNIFKEYAKNEFSYIG